jgi:hypothetical protein
MTRQLKTRPLVDLLPILIWTFAWIPATVQNALAENALSAGTLSLRLYDRTTKSTAPSPPNSIRIVKVAVNVPGSPNVPTIQRLLLDHHIYPNVDAVTLVYEWNPDVTSLRKLVPDESLIIPSAVSSEPDLVAFSENLFIWIDLDASLKEQLQRITSIVDSIAQSDIPRAIIRFNSKDPKSPVWEDFKKAVGQLDKINSAVAENTRPISHQMLTRVVSQAQLLQLLATTNDTKQFPRFISDSQLIDYIVKDLAIQAATLIDIKSTGAVADSNKSILVTVRVFKPGSDAETSGYRVYYVGAFEKDITKPSSMSSLFPPISAKLSPGYYSIWAARENGDSAVEDTKIWTNPIDDSFVGPLDLELLQGR